MLSPAFVCHSHSDVWLGLIITPSPANREFGVPAHTQLEHLQVLHQGLLWISLSSDKFYGHQVCWDLWKREVHLSCLSHPEGGCGSTGCPSHEASGVVSCGSLLWLGTECRSQCAFQGCTVLFSLVEWLPSALSSENIYDRRRKVWVPGDGITPGFLLPDREFLSVVTPMFFHTPTDTTTFLDKEEDDGTQMRERNGLRELGYVGVFLPFGVFSSWISMSDLLETSLGLKCFFSCSTHTKLFWVVLFVFVYNAAEIGWLDIFKIENWCLLRE